MALDLGGNLVGIAEKSVVLIEEIGLSPDPANALQAGDESELPLRLGAVQLLRRRPILGQTRDFLSDDLLDLRERSARPGRGNDREEACDLLGSLEAVDVRTELAVVYQRLIETG